MIRYKIIKGNEIIAACDEIVYAQEIAMALSEKFPESFIVKGAAGAFICAYQNGLATADTE